MKASIQRNLCTFGPFAAVERVLMAAVQAGADRQELHEVLRRLSMSAWQSIQDGQGNPLSRPSPTNPRSCAGCPKRSCARFSASRAIPAIAAPAARELAAQIRGQFKE